eukprot:TRINITY_DN9311_c0_g1_i2.p1 TRINITY_DN9311_c0_g1~~TRINITY_DN9311_c0_g1_i2.p1  ORF type:complete len:416 (+),score=104.65 TRINITY_DN9311_c0_g1_i2:73-1320(+)
MSFERLPSSADEMAQIRDVEAVSDSEDTVTQERGQPLRSRIFSKPVLAVGSLVGIFAALSTGSHFAGSHRPQQAALHHKEVISLADKEDIWESVLGGDALNQMHREQDNKGKPRAPPVPPAPVAPAPPAPAAPPAPPPPVATVTVAPVAPAPAPAPVPAPVPAPPPMPFPPAPPPVPVSRHSSIPVPVPVPVPAPSPSGSYDNSLPSLEQQFRNHARGHTPGSPEHAGAVGVANMIHKHLTRQEAGGLIPAETTHDGNVCPDDEEEHPKGSGECYVKCSTFFGGQYPIRTSAFSCCASHPCSFKNQKVNMAVCGGFDTSGAAEQSRCPTEEGACLTDEELLNGICYKKCSLFPENKGTYIHRTAPNVCCSTTGFGCLIPGNIKFNAKFGEGGGKGDGNPDTPAGAHMPIKELTES